MTKIGNWKSRKARRQDMARRDSCCPSGRSALSKEEAIRLPLLAWIGRFFILFWTLVIVGIVVAIKATIGG